MPDCASFPTASGLCRGLPPICGNEEQIERATAERSPAFLVESNIDIERVQSAFALALHVHQPMIPAGAEDLPTAPLISNLQYLQERGGDQGSSKACQLVNCYGRIAGLVRGLARMGRSDILAYDFSSV